MVVFTIIVVLLGWVLGASYGYGNEGIILAVLISIIMTLSGFYAGDSVALASAGAKPIEKKD